MANQYITYIYTTLENPLFCKPWVQSAVHLGHTIHQDLTLDADARARRARFISSSVEVRNKFSFASPHQILKAVRIFSCDAYGSVLWRLDSPSASSYYKSYSSCVRRIWRLPVNTYTYLVEGHLSSGLPPLRNMVLGRYPRFFWRLSYSPSCEVQVMARISACDRRTVTASNLAHLSALTGLDPECTGSLEFQESLPVLEVPDKEVWRVGLLDALLKERSDSERKGLNIKRLVSLISSLCTT